MAGGFLTGMLWSLRPLCEEATWARYWMTFFVFSVLPAPDSPLGNSSQTHRQKDGVSLRVNEHMNKRRRIKHTGFM